MSSMDQLSQKFAEEAQKDSSAQAAAAKAEDTWQQHLARTTAVLAVLAAMATARYGGAGEKAILLQSQESDAWNYYQAKNIKQSVEEAQAGLGQALVGVNPGQWSLELYTAERAMDAGRLDVEKKKLEAAARKLADEREKFRKQSDFFEFAFIALQVGVVMTSVAGAAKRRWMWQLSLVLGAVGVAMMVVGFFPAILGPLAR